MLFGTAVALIGRGYPQIDILMVDELLHMRASANTVWKEKLLFPKILHSGPGSPCPFKGRKQHPKGVLNLSIRIKMDNLIFHIPQPDWQLELEGCSLRFIQDASP